jgi:hypothetical protein
MMKRFGQFLSAILLLVCFASRAFAQDTYAPLFLYTNGAGCLTSLTNGQTLEVGQNYEMTASPATGYVFSGWQVMNVYVLDEVVPIQGSGLFSTNESIIRSPVDGIYTNGVTLQFTMQPENVLLSTTNRTLTQSMGWAANFVPVPIQLQGVSTNKILQVTVAMQFTNYTTIVQASPDLVNWTNVCTNTPPFTFTNLMTAPACFYRAEVDTNGD